MTPIDPTETTEFIFLLRGTQFENRLSLQEMQEAMGKYMGWLNRFAKEGKFKGGQPLAPAGKFVTGKQERTISDGPFAEAKEAIGGYLLFAVADLDAAVAIAETCPLLDYGSVVEVRPVLDLCPTIQKLNALKIEFAA